MNKASQKAKKILLLVWRYPHHYATAVLMTIAAVGLGELHVTVVALFWIYAISENLTAKEIELEIERDVVKYEERKQ